MGVGGQCHALAALLPGGEKKPVQIVPEAGRAAGPVWTDTGNLDLPKFDPRTVQPVASRYTDYTIPANATPCFGKN